MPSFIPGLELARAFYQQAVKPILSQHYPQLSYSAGLIGSGSEVLGYDDQMSTDHHWGPRLLLFLPPPVHQQLAAPISTTLSGQLPYDFLGYPTNFSAPKHEAGDNGTQLLQAISQGAINHRIEILTIDGFMRAHLGIGAEQQWAAADWLSIPQQKLLSFTGGDLFHDDLGLGAIRDRLHYYPQDIWLYLLACGWQRISQDEHLAPRAALVGDELGAALITSRLVRSIMQLAFLLERRYMPYPKWLGSAFAELACAGELAPLLRAIQQAGDFDGAEKQLCAAYTLLNDRYNKLKLTAPIQPAVEPFHGRGFMVSNGWRYAEALRAVIADPELEAIAAQSLIGSIDQFSDNSDLRSVPHLRRSIAKLYSIQEA